MQSMTVCTYCFSRPSQEDVILDVSWMENVVYGITISTCANLEVFNDATRVGVAHQWSVGRLNLGSVRAVLSLIAEWTASEDNPIGYLVGICLEGVGSNAEPVKTLYG